MKKNKHINNNKKYLIGKVIKVNIKSILVIVSKIKKHNLYKKFIKKNTKINVHDENRLCKLNDIICIKYFKPISKTKSWVLHKIINKNL